MVFADESVVRLRRVSEQFLYKCEDQPIEDPARTEFPCFFLSGCYRQRYDVEK